jgi:hypothetical protein
VQRGISIRQSHEARYYGMKGGSVDIKSTCMDNRHVDFVHHLICAESVSKLPVFPIPLFQILIRFEKLELHVGPLCHPGHVSLPDWTERARARAASTGFACVRGCVCGGHGRTCGAHANRRHPRGARRLPDAHATNRRGPLGRPRFDCAPPPGHHRPQQQRGISTG